MKHFKFWKRWLLWVNVAVLGLGVLVAFAGNSIMPAMRRAFF